MKGKEETGNISTLLSKVAEIAKDGNKVDKAIEALDAILSDDNLSSENRLEDGCLEKDIAMKIATYMLNTALNERDKATRKDDFFELTSERAEHIIKAILNSKELEFEYVSLPYKSYKEWGDKECMEFRKHIGETISLDVFAGKWKNLMESSTIPEGLGISYDKDVFYSALRGIVADFKRYRGDLNMFPMLKEGIALLLTNGHSEEDIKRLFKEIYPVAKKDAYAEVERQSSKEYQEFIKECQEEEATVPQSDSTDDFPF